MLTWWSVGICYSSKASHAQQHQPWKKTQSMHFCAHIHRRYTLLLWDASKRFLKLCPYSIYTTLKSFIFSTVVKKMTQSISYRNKE